MIRYLEAKLTLDYLRMPATNTSLQMLDRSATCSHSCAPLRAKQPVKYTAFYSSQLGGVVTDPGADGDPVRRSHGPSRPRHLRHRGHRQRQDLRSRCAPRSLPEIGGAIEAEAAGIARRDARHHHQDHRGQRAARRLDPLLAVVRPRQSRSDAGGRRRSRLLRDDLPGPRLSRTSGRPTACAS